MTLLLSIIAALATVAFLQSVVLIRRGHPDRWLPAIPYLSAAVVLLAAYLAIR